MKIVYILQSSFGTFGAAASYMFPTIMGRNNHEVTVISPRPPKIESKKRHRIVFEPENISLIFLPIRSSLISKCLFINKTVKKIGPDIVHVFFDHRSFLYPLLFKILNPGRKIKWILDVRTHIIRTGEKKIKTKLTSPIKQLNYNAIFGIKEHSIWDRLEFVFKPVHVIPIGVDTSLFKKRMIKNKKDIITIEKFVYIGVMSHIRELSKLLQGIWIAKNQIAEKKCFIVDFYGTGDAEERLKNEVREYGIQDIVKFNGVVPQRTLFDKLNSYDVGLAFIPNGIYEKAPGLKTLEYIAASLFIIGSNTFGNREFVRHGYSGVLIENTAEDYGKAISDAVNYGLPNSYRINAKKILKHNDWNYIVKEKLTQAYLEVLSP